MAARAYPRRLKSGSPYHKNLDHISYGLYAAEVREVVRRFKPRFAQLSLTQKLSLAGQLYRAGIAELAEVATALLASCRQDLSPAHFRFLDRCLDHFHGWGTTDDFSVNVLQPLLLRHRAATQR